MKQYLIRNLTKNMFVPGREHLERLEKFGKTLCAKSIYQKRYFIDLITHDFGNRYLNQLKMSEIESFLMKDSHSGSWKNYYLETFKNIYDETQWLLSKPVTCPPFKRFSRNSRKADILTTSELQKIFDRHNWKSEQIYLCFYVIASCGLRLGEGRALQKRQFNLEKKFLVIDGFCRENGERTNYCKGGNQENSKMRITPLSDELIVKLNDYFLSHDLDENDFVFQEDGHPLSKSLMYKSFKRALIQSKIEPDGRKICPHSLRFTYVTRMRRHLSAEQVQKIVGHTSIEMTEYYSRFGIDEMTSSIQTAYGAANSLFQ
ncbi:MAG: site-specific integrase [Treponemataceae bacterium]|nr:site-specific integrase [Treponemataceae bacterium]